MTYEADCILSEELLEQIAQQGLDVLPELIRTVINTAMQIERQNHLSAAPYERSRERQGHANGYKPKVGIPFLVPFISRIFYSEPTSAAYL
jgi:putative transposase